MTVSEKAVEKALRAAHEHASDDFEDMIRAALTAALPHIGVERTQPVDDLPALDALVVYYMSRGWPSYSDRERADKEWTAQKAIAQSAAFKRHLARTSSGALLTGAAPAGPDGCDVAQKESARPRPDQPAIRALSAQSGSGVERREDVARAHPGVQELRERPTKIPVAELPAWLRRYADALDGDIDANPYTVAAYLNRAADELDGKHPGQPQEEWQANTARAISSLENSAHNIMAVDGDRDHMNQSRLTCEQTQMAAKLMRAVAQHLSAAPASPHSSLS